MSITVVITPECLVCHRTSTFNLDSNKVQEWQSGALIQNVFPNLTSDEREQLISGTHGECWDKMFEGVLPE